MIKLFSVKDKAKKPAGEGDAANKANKLSAAELRIQKDLVELSLPKNISIHFPEGKEKTQHFEITICPDEGVYKGGKFLFDFTIPSGYPHEAPKVVCKTKVFHPNLDLEGKICLNILREDWKPVLSISSVIYGLQFLFLDPNPEDPLNKEAAQLFQDNPRQFQTMYREASKAVAASMATTSPRALQDNSV
eukprot:CAMPEP_0202354814 /NCGR_PEP_ID=MMETSP1126-20121109/9969_1 /ASSEMBLY_ACC=CAM_ASM_000457 /TAXON_ID=3047 /ORGANISM="Dunaliella tertiolecta, Strain CCMP1320" /LENGTH=189 /DNA_ID=CAMNT_0048947327 /DNA_START=150 /DNA_END=720 /DNA_ORIENTATION=-